jgi:hypothetical protein
MILKPWQSLAAAAALAASLTPSVRAGEADIKIPDLGQVSFLDGALSGYQVLYLGLAVCVVGIQGPPGSPVDGSGLEHHLGDLQDLPCAAG